MEFFGIPATLGRDTAAALGLDVLAVVQAIGRGAAEHQRRDLHLDVVELPGVLVVNVNLGVERRIRHPERRAARGCAGRNLKLIQSLSDEPVIVSFQATAPPLSVTMPVPVNEPSEATLTV